MTGNLKESKKHFPNELRIYSNLELNDHTSKTFHTSFHVIFDAQYLTKRQAIILANKISKLTGVKIKQYQTTKSNLRSSGDKS